MRIWVIFIWTVIQMEWSLPLLVCRRNAGLRHFCTGFICLNRRLLPGSLSSLHFQLQQTSLGTRQICKLMFYLLWQISLVPFLFKLISSQPGKPRVTHNCLSGGFQTIMDSLGPLCFMLGTLRRGQAMFY